MTNREKIEEQLTNDKIVIGFTLVNEINVNMFIYNINFDEQNERWNGLYDCCLIENDMISYVNH